MEPSPSRPIITLMTDFGSDSSYVAQMKGVILSRNPAAQLVDITHGIPPQDILSGAIALADVTSFFPPRTIHVAVVDPGVGTSRQIVCAQIGGQFFIAPDNGLLTLVSQRQKPKQLVSVTNRTYFSPEVSETFHGRDIMAPVAAHLSLGLTAKRLGQSIPSLIMLDIPKPIAEKDRVTGQVIQIDSFGNAIANISVKDLKRTIERGSMTVECENFRGNGIATTYGLQPPGSSVALISSSGRVELAIVNGNAHRQLGIKTGDRVVITW